MINPTEKRFELHIEKSLNEKGYKSVHYNDYDKNLCLLTEELIGFIKETHEEEYQNLQDQYGSETDKKLSKRVSEEITRRGVIDVLRNGVEDRGSKFNLIFFEPNSGLNPEHRESYKKNRFIVVRQLHYSIKNENSIDMVLFVNGVPILTMELKNQLTGQTIIDSQKQYRYDRDSNELLLKFKRCIVHFCVDNDRVSMTTRLSKGRTIFLPFNRDIENPLNPNGYRTHYLWENILTPNSILDIIENFIFISIQVDKVWSDKEKKVIDKKKELLIFPRYHQLDVTRKLKQSIKDEGVGNKYLIQHTTGSGKSFSIGWLSHLLTSLFQTMDDTERMFDTIIVITDRTILDKQLQDTIKQLEQTKGVVNPVNLNSQQLKEFLEEGKDIIITTIQKFPFISETISRLSGNTFGIIIDEVHSSQTGERSKHLKKVLLDYEIEEDEEGNFDYEELIRKEIKSRGKQDHISFFGFTGTPKNKTLEVFGRKNEQGEFKSFHYYTMEQSIKEGFTLDVLENYVTYKRWFELNKKVEDDDILPKTKVIKELVKFVDSQDTTIQQKVQIILDHFVKITSKKIEGKGRGMIVVRSRKHCVQFYKEMLKQMKNLDLHYSCLVGFSGTVRYEGLDFTEKSLNLENGLDKNVSIPDGFKDPKYRILIVSSKFQTGFNEPYLQSMYVDKKLNNVQCVQTLSRLNRTTYGKTSTFVLDFVNSPDVIVDSFQEYYKTTTLSGETDPNKLYDLKTDIYNYHVFTTEDVDEFCQLFVKVTETDESLQPILNKCVSDWEMLSEEDIKEDFRSLIQSYLRLYGYISQIISFEDLELEKLFIFLKYLNKKLPKRDSTRVDITDSSELMSLRIQKISEGRLLLDDTEGIVDPFKPHGSKYIEEEMDYLSNIIIMMNEVHGTNFTDKEKVNFEKIRDELIKDEELKEVHINDNTFSNRQFIFNKVFDRILLELVDDDVDFYNKVSDPNRNNFIKNSFYREYTKVVNK